MPLETLRFIICIGTHTDSIPLSGPQFCKHLAEAVENYRKECHSPEEIVELESVIDPVETVLWDNDKWCAESGKQLFSIEETSVEQLIDEENNAK